MPNPGPQTRWYRASGSTDVCKRSRFSNAIPLRGPVISAACRFGNIPMICSAEKLRVVAPAEGLGRSAFSAGGRRHARRKGDQVRNEGLDQSWLGRLACRADADTSNLV